MGYVVGLEVEWYLLRVAQDQLGDENIGAPGVRGAPIKTVPPEPGYLLSLRIQHGPDAAGARARSREAFEKLDLPLRSVENEWGPGQVECTFAAGDALDAADNLLLFRTATRQICRRMGYFATFMCRPALKGYYSSGWHLHQSLVDATSGRNLFMPRARGEVLSPLGRQFRRRPAAARRAGDRVHDADRQRLPALPAELARARPRHLVLRPSRRHDPRARAAPGDPATRLENRVGEPAANPYLFIASQIVAGLDGVERALDPRPAGRRALRGRAPAAAEEPAGRARRARTASRCSAAELGDVFIDYFLKLKRNEAGRFQRGSRRAACRRLTTRPPTGSSASISISSSMSAADLRHCGATH